MLLFCNRGLLAEISLWAHVVISVWDMVTKWLHGRVSVGISVHFWTISALLVRPIGIYLFLLFRPEKDILIV